MEPNKDYYKILGVSEKAPIAEIKSAYRKLAKKHHPDMNPTNKKAAEEMFKKISEAYYVLGDEKRKSEYDSFRTMGYAPQGARGGQQYYTGAQGFDIDDLLSHLGFGGRGRRAQARGGMDFDVFDDIFGGSFSPGERKNFSRGYAQEPMARKASTDVNAAIEIPQTLARNGGKIDLTLPGKKNITVTIPKGITDGTKLRLHDLGDPCPHCSHKGDLLIKVNVR